MQMLSLIHMAKYEETKSDDFLRNFFVFVPVIFKSCFSGWPANYLLSSGQFLSTI